MGIFESSPMSVELLTELAMHRTTQTLTTIFSCMFGAVIIARVFLKAQPAENHRWLPDPTNAADKASGSIIAAKRATELWFLGYGVIWILCFGVIVGGQLYEWFGKVEYMVVCGGLAAPLYIQPLLFPGVTADSGRPLLERHSFKANLWLAIFGFVGNYWYTHYFYSVLKASYTMPSWDLNGVPIPMFFATHFYFTFYHAVSNCILRKAYTTYEPTIGRQVYVVAIILAFSYTTAFMESLTIAAFPCYSFADRHMAYTLGSAFYGIYFIVSFPMFLRIDEPHESEQSKTSLRPFSWGRSAIEALASSMLVLCLLDFVRVGVVQEDLNITLPRPCKLDAALTCGANTYFPD